MEISQELLEITQNTSPGYHPLTQYDKWLVAVLNEGDDNNAFCKINCLEYHAQTDEVFILLKGKATLIVSGGRDKPEKIQKVDIEPLKCFNVKKGVWHSIVLQDGGVVAIVENSNTSKDNSEYYYLSDEEKEMLL